MVYTSNRNILRIGIFVSCFRLLSIWIYINTIDYPPAAWAILTEDEGGNLFAGYKTTSTYDDPEGSYDPDGWGGTITVTT